MSRRQRSWVRSRPDGWAPPDEIAAAAVYFSASTEAGYVTGQTLHVNGGMAMI
jgi:NAD(P)-dependent dehydrogenase (short-subunit alcohol dehydrogenase family)